MNKKQSLKIKSNMENQEVPHFMVKIINNPTITVKGGKFTIDICNYLSDIIEGKSQDDICNMITGGKYETMESFIKIIKSTQRKDNKKMKIKEEKFVAKDESGTIIKLITNYKYYCDSIKSNISEEDRNNKVYFYNDKFNMMKFVNSKWKEFQKNRKEFSKLSKKVDKENDKIQKHIDEIKSKSGFVDKPKKPTKNSFLLYKYEKQEEFDKYYEKHKSKLQKIKMVEYTIYASQKWNKESDVVKLEYSEKVKAKYTKQMIEYSKKLDLWNTYQSKKKSERSDKSGDESGDESGNESENESGDESGDEPTNEPGDEPANEPTNESSSDSDSDSD